MIKAYELTLQEAVKRFPELIPLILSLNIDITDPNYVVRFGEYGIEIGYPEDEWIMAA